MEQKPVCKQCGTPLITKKLQLGTFYESVPYCPTCNQIESGTQWHIYDSAETFVSKGAFQYFMHMDEDERCEQRNVAKVCEILNAFYYDLESVEPAEE